MQPSSGASPPPSASAPRGEQNPTRICPRRCRRREIGASLAASFQAGFRPTGESLCNTTGNFVLLMMRAFYWSKNRRNPINFGYFRHGTVAAPLPPVTAPPSSDVHVPIIRFDTFRTLLPNFDVPNAMVRSLDEDCIIRAAENISLDMTDFQYSIMDYGMM